MFVLIQTLRSKLPHHISTKRIQDKQFSVCYKKFIFPEVPSPTFLSYLFTKKNCVKLFPVNFSGCSHGAHCVAHTHRQRDTDTQRHIDRETQRETHRLTHTHIQRQTDTQTEILTYTPHTNTHRERFTYIHRLTHTHELKKKEKERHREGQPHTHTDRQIHHTHTNKHTHTPTNIHTHQQTQTQTQMSGHFIDFYPPTGRLESFFEKNSDTVYFRKKLKD